MQQFDPIAKHLVLIGGGHSHVIFIRMLAMDPIPGLQVSLISPEVETPYSGMLPGVVAGHFSRDEIHIDLVPLCRFAGVRFIKTRVIGMDPVAQLIHCDTRPDISYDVVSINTGITPANNALESNDERVVAVKPISTFLTRFEEFLQRIKLDSNRRVAVIGAGAGGVELCLALAYRLKQTCGPSMNQLHLVFDGSTILETYPTNVRAAFQQKLKGLGITEHENFRVTQSDNGTLISEDGEKLVVDEVFWVTDAGAPDWIKRTGLAVSAQGFIAIRDTLQAKGFDNVFAAGDIADVILHPRPKAGVYAVRQGPVLFNNVRRFLLGHSPVPFKPQADFLSLLSCGDQTAIASRNGFVMSGRWVWLWKQWIDKRFMARFTDLPKMVQVKPKGLLNAFDDQMQCGGCGSKVNGTLLSEALEAVDIATDQLDDAAIYPVSGNQVMLHTIDAFKSFIDDPYILAQVAVQHALSDIYAMGGTPVTALSTITVQRGKPGVTKNQLQLLLAGSKKVLDEEGVQLVGGHTTEGAELFIGFAVNGTAEADALMTKAGARPGDVLILTKPLGSGVLFAADMQYQASGSQVYAALESMTQSNKLAMQVFKAAGVKSCTDITGFGLAGHLLEMLRASKVTAELHGEQLPLFVGVSDLYHQNKITSTLHEGNQALVAPYMEPVIKPHLSAPFLYDPQTSGGLLAAVPSEQAAEVLAELYKAGYHASCQIGEIVADLTVDEVAVDKELDNSKPQTKYLKLV